MVTLKINGEIRQFPKGTTFETIAKEYQKDYDAPILVVIENGKIKELSKKVNKDCEVKFITLKDTIGHMTYVRTALMIMLKAIEDVVGKEKITKLKVDFAIGHGYYCAAEGDFKIDGELVDEINERMNEIVEDKIPITKRPFHVDEAMELFREQGMTDKEKLFKYRRSSYINVYCMDGSRHF